jgi:hypothetical protein
MSTLLRSLLDTSRRADCAANDGGMTFHVRARLADGTYAGFTTRFVDSVAAAEAGLDKYGLGARIEVEPAEGAVDLLLADLQRKQAATLHRDRRALERQIDANRRNPLSLGAY